MENEIRPSSRDSFSVSYRIVPPPGVTPERFARDIAEEQTVEIPHESIPQELLDNGIVGRVSEISAESDGFFRAVITYRNDVTAFCIPQLLNVLYGNVSLKRNIRIIGLECSEGLLSSLGGPKFGIEGVRALAGVSGRPLLCTALKPMGLSASEFAAVAGACARGGVDLIKDDHGIGDQLFCRFEERIPRVVEAVAAANVESGTHTLYFPNLCGPRDALERQAECAVRNGVRGVLCAPQLVGYDTVRWLADTYHLMVMAHPAFTGSLFTSGTEGCDPAVFLGTLFRMAGADISIFPSWGGRFPFTRDECIGIADACTRPMSPLREAFPAPAGGITLEKTGAIAEAYGSEAVLLVGGALLGNGDGLSGSVKDFLDAVGEHFTETQQPPAEPFRSSCEIPRGSTKLQQPVSFVPFDAYRNRWKGREEHAYKTEGAAGFDRIRRTELIGGSDARTAFDLRYFEIGPGGYSSHEKHLHEHVIIGVRGTGFLLKSGQRFTIRPNDIARVGRLEPHQLRNEQEQPFGFYCIVDHERDRPVSLTE